MGTITMEELKNVVVHLSDREFEELVEAREQAWYRQIEADAEAGLPTATSFARLA